MAMAQTGQMARLAPLLLAPLLLAAAPAQWRQSPWHDPMTLYRIDRLRSPVPAPPEGVAMLDAAAVARLAPRALLVDVTPVLNGRRDPASGRWQLPGPALSLPGALWFPDAGRAPGDAATITQFVQMVTARAGRRRLIVFCLADCWLSWNAALRLHRAGLAVAWFPGGRDGWAAAGRPLVPVLPVPP
jgi:PQQ-dependent catabolism-associated CXXCW motif protein